MYSNMSAYQEKLRELTQDEVVSQLEGADGLLALTRAELFYIGEAGAQRAPLGEIKKVVGGKGGTLVVMGEDTPLIEAPVRAFQVDELRLFFESVKTFVARQKQVGAQSPAPSPQKEAVGHAQERPLTVDEDTSAPVNSPAAGAPPSRPTRPAEIYSTEPAVAPPKRRGGLSGGLLKLFSLATLGATGYWIYTNPTADLSYLIFTGVLGLGVALVEWHASNL